MITINGITLSAPRAPRQGELLTADALSFLAALHREFGPRLSRLAAAAGETTAGQTAAGDAPEWNTLVRRLLEEPARGIGAPRGLAEQEVRMFCAGAPLAAGLVDVALFLHRHARRLTARGAAPFVSLPAPAAPETGEEELLLWQGIFSRSEELLGLPEGTVRAIHVREAPLAAAA